MDERRHRWKAMTGLFSIIGNSMVNGVGVLFVQLKLVFNKKELSTALSETRLERETIEISSPSSREQFLFGMAPAEIWISGYCSFPPPTFLLLSLSPWPRTSASLLHADPLCTLNNNFRLTYLTTLFLHCQHHPLPSDTYPPLIAVAGGSSPDKYLIYADEGSVPQQIVSSPSTPNHVLVEDYSDEDDYDEDEVDYSNSEGSSNVFLFPYAVFYWQAIGGNS